MLFIFDMGGVVTTTFSMDSMYKSLKMDSKEFMEICKTGNNIFSEYTKGTIGCAQFWAQFNERIKDRDVYPVKHDLFRLYFHPVLNKGTVEVIEKLKKKHRVICGTNTIQSHWENHMERGDYAFFDQTYASNKIGEEKPDESFFKVILEAEGYKADEAFFVDDRLENVEAARRAGINSVHFESAEQLKKEWKKYF